MTKQRRYALPSPEEIERHFHDSISLMRSVRSTLSDLLSEIADSAGGGGGGGSGTLREIGLKHAELETALKRAFEAEAKYDDWQAKQAKESGGGEAIDYVALREDIACRLARLRDCCHDA